jgi:hypothetical protein
VETEKTRPKRKKDIISDFWGPAAKEAGFTCVPTILIHQLRGLDITLPEFTVLYFLITNGGNRPIKVSKETISRSLPIGKSMVGKHIASLKKKGYLRTIETKVGESQNESNEYRLDGLIEAVNIRAEFKLKQKRERENDNRRKLDPRGASTRELENMIKDEDEAKFTGNVRKAFKKRRGIS